MAANNSDSLLNFKNIVNYTNCDKNNILKSFLSNTCSTHIGSCNVIEDNQITSKSDGNYVSSTEDVNISDIESDGFIADTPNTRDMQFSSDDSFLNTSFNTNFNEGTELDNEFLSSYSENEFGIKNYNNNEPELDTISLSSLETCIANFPHTKKCAVTLCNEYTRNQFDTLFFINFPTGNTALCDTWWTICGHTDKFDPSSKICSIHFGANDFTSMTIRKDGHLFRQTILKNNTIVPTLYLLPHEFTKFSRKRKNNTNDYNNTEKKQKISETRKCVIQSCKKTFSKDCRSTLFFKFPMDNKIMLKKWLEKIGLTNWQPLDTDRICSDHFENYYVIKYNNVYELDKYAIPSIKPKNPFAIKSKFSNCIKSSTDKCNFRKLSSDVLLVNEINENLLENNTELVEQPKLHKDVPETATTVSNLTKNNFNKGENVLSSQNKCNNSSLEYMDVLDDLNNIKELELEKLGNSTSITRQYLESFEKEIAEELEVHGNSTNSNNDLDYIYLDLFDNERNIIEAQSIINTNDELTSKYNKTQLELNRKENNMNNIPTHVSNDSTPLDMPFDKCTTVIIEDSQVKPYSIFGETGMISKSNKNNENDCININLNISNDVGELLPSKKKCIQNSSNNKKGKQILTETDLKTKEYDIENMSVDIYNVNTDNIVSAINSSNLTKKWNIELIEKQNPEENPKCIIYNQDLTECYGEMLPPYCNPDCQLTCFISIPGPERREIYNEFQILGVTEQNCKITELVKKGETFESCMSYHLTMNKKLIKVCQLFFRNTLGIPKQRLDAVLKPIHYNWYSDKDTALKVNIPKQVMVTDESILKTDFINESLILLNTDYNLYEPESDTEVSLENVSMDEYEKVWLFLKSIPRVLTEYQMFAEKKKIFFETSICCEIMYKTYSENYIRKKTSPPYNKRQFKKIYNQCMKTLLKMV